MDTHATTTTEPDTTEPATAAPFVPAGVAVLPMGEFVGLLTDAARIASTDPTVRMLCGVLLHTTTHHDRTVLVASATDRYMMVQAHAPLRSGDLPGRLWLTNDQIRRLRALFGTPTRRRSKARDVRIAVSRRSNSCIISEFDEPGGAAALSLAPIDTRPDFPDIAEMVRRERHRHDDPVEVNPRLLARATALCRPGEALRIELTGQHSPIHITIGERLWAYLMPRRGDTTTTTPPVFDLPPTTPHPANNGRAEAAA